MYTFFYGIKEESQIDVTELTLKYFTKNNVIRIPGNDPLRGLIFTDPVINKEKFFYVYSDNVLLYTADNKTELYIDMDLNEIFNKSNLTEKIKNIYPDPHEKLRSIHATMSFAFGKIEDEYPEQVLATEFLTGNETILELGANIGRNTLVMDYLTNKKGKIVTLESDEKTSYELEHNRRINKASFYIENAALSTTPLYQKEGEWITKKSDIPLDGYKLVNTTTFDKIEAKYSMKFDTLVVDCEGSMYYILQEMPEMLTNIKLIIIENDFNEIEHKQFVDSKFREYGLSPIYFEKGGWGPCFPFFYEVWKRIV